MNAAFDNMLNILDCSSSESSESSQEDLQEPAVVVHDLAADKLAADIEEIRQMRPDPQPHIIIPAEMIEVEEYDPSNNLLDEDIRQEFETECVYEETAIFGRVTSTTNTVEGFLSNVSFTEEDFIHYLMPDENIVMYRCNFGKLKYDYYTEPVKVKKTNRGRKKKPKKEKNRKKQGNGGDFNSQITFVVRSSTVNVLPNLIYKDGFQEPPVVPYNAKVYKFKIFRTGKLQLPGVHPSLINDVISCTDEIIKVLNFQLHPGERNPAKLTNIININPVMKNYKFVIKFPIKVAQDFIIDLDELRKILQREQMRHHLGGVVNDENMTRPLPEHPPIFLLKYTRQDTKLSIKFSTPIYKKQKKRTRVNIFMRGKVNILGGFDANVTRQICDYLHWIFENNYDRLVVPEGYTEPVEVLSENILLEDTDDLYKYFTTYIPDLPEMTTEDCDDIMNFINEVYDERIAEAKNCLDDLCREIADWDMPMIEAY